MLPLMALTLWLLGFTRTQSMLATLAPIDKNTGPGQKQATVYQAHVTAKMVTVAAQRGPFRASCLPQSLVLWWLLRRQGIDNELRFGVRKNPDRLEAHAWVELSNTVLNDRADVSRRFLPFKRASVLANGSSE